MLHCVGEVNYMQAETAISSSTRACFNRWFIMGTVHIYITVGSTHGLPLQKFGAVKAPMFSANGQPDGQATHTH